MKFEVRRRGRRFWVSGPVPLRSGAWYHFWSDHKRNFYHGMVKLEGDSLAWVLWSRFQEWLPY